MEKQTDICAKYDATFVACDYDAISGIADNVQKGNTPINGLRHLLTDGSTGWYIWSGTELSSNADFFKLKHLSHIIGDFPEIVPYLGLEPGWRFLIDVDENHIDVWFDKELLKGAM